MKTIKFFLVLSVLLGSSLFSFSTASAGDAINQGKLNIIDAGKQVYGEEYTAPVPLEVVIGRGVQALLGLLGLIFLILIIYGGFKWMTARGNEQEVEEARDTIMRATVGLIIILAAYAISEFVIQSLYEAVVTPPGTIGPDGG